MARRLASRVRVGRSVARRGLKDLDRRIMCLCAEIRYESRKAKPCKARITALKEQAFALDSQRESVKGWRDSLPWFTTAKGLSYGG